jgi:hypothetical protein
MTSTLDKASRLMLKAEHRILKLRIPAVEGTPIMEILTKARVIVCAEAKAQRTAEHYPEEFQVLRARLDIANARVRESEALTAWVKITDRLPTDGGKVNLLNPGYEPAIGRLHTDNAHWWVDDEESETWARLNDFKLWCPISVYGGE